MTKTIHQLIPDIYSTIKDKETGWFTDELARGLSTDIGERLQGQLGKNRDRPTLRLSQMGPRCPRALWYSIHHPELAEQLPPWAEIKYAYGHVLEALAISLAKASGHTVTGEQDAVYVDGVTGHRDCVIDGCIVDVKSSSSRGFEKFKNGSIATSDDFGYLDQLDGYLVGSLSDSLVSVKDRGYLLAIDKTLGHMCLYEHTVRPLHIRERIQRYKDIVNGQVPPPCECETRPQGKSGNIQLGVKPSYSLFKFQCFPKLRTFLYANGPVYLSHVEVKPDVKEIDRNGRVVYN